MNDYNNTTPEKESDTNGQPQQTDAEPISDSQHIKVQLQAFIIMIWKRIAEFIRIAASFFQTNTGSDESVKGDVRRAFSSLSLRKAAVGSVLIGFLLYLLSGIYVVNPGEEAVEKLFGKVVNQRISEGMHFRLPWPFQAVDIVNVSVIRREGVGLLLPEHQSIHSSPEVIQFLSGDDNIVDIQTVVQYRIKDASAFLYNINYPDYLLINEIIRSAITEIGGGMQVDDILTIGKERLQDLIRVKAQGLLDQYRSGIQLVGLNLNKVYPPEEVAEAFRDVSNAKQDREKRVSDAWGYRNTVVPQARGDAVKLIRESEAYKIAAINKASGDAGRFKQMLTEYNNDRRKFTTDVTVTRLYLESMGKVLARVKKFIVDPDKDGVLNLRLIQ